MSNVARVATQSVACCLVLWSATSVDGQEASVRPGINTSFVEPNVAEFVERFESEGREVYDQRDAIVAACGIQPGMVVADIGCGTGLFSRLMAPLVGNRGRLVAVDITEEFVNHVVSTSHEQGVKNVTGVVCRVDSVQLPAESIDLAFICDTYHHFEYPYKTMRSIHRALKPNGKLVVVDFHRIEGQSSEWILGHVRAGKDVFLHEIELSGFQVVDEQDFLETSYWVRLEKSARRNVAGHTIDSLQDVRALMANGTAVLIDVREPDEWDAGHLADAQLVPLSKIADDRTTAEALALPNDKIIYCHCRSGGRVLGATKILAEKGYDIRPLADGFQSLVRAGFSRAEEHAGAD